MRCILVYKTFIPSYLYCAYPKQVLTSTISLFKKSYVDLNWILGNKNYLNWSKNNPSGFLQQQVILEMNRLGMMIDLAHVSVAVMNQVLDLSKAPVIFSHSSAYSICPSKRNVPDDVLLRVVSMFVVVVCERVFVWSLRRQGVQPFLC